MMRTAGAPSAISRADRHFKKPPLGFGAAGVIN
jgi:hypothetical protein